MLLEVEKSGKDYLLTEIISREVGYDTTGLCIRIVSLSKEEAEGILCSKRYLSWWIELLDRKVMDREEIIVQVDHTL